MKVTKRLVKFVLISHSPWHWSKHRSQHVTVHHQASLTAPGARLQ